MQDQATLWNGRGGRGWVETQEVLDRLFQPFEDLLVEAVAAARRKRVLDIGCGTGATTVAVAKRAGADAMGVDISDPMIEAARSRAQRDGVPATFVRADAQTYPFEAASFDMVLSRFGVMFFDDPVQAFKNLRRATTDDAELRFIAWRSPAENPFMTTAERAAAPVLPDLPPRRPDAPGQFGFSDPGRVQTILEQSGWRGIEIEPLDVPCTVREEDLVRYVNWMGPVGMALQGADEETRGRVLRTVLPAFDSYRDGSSVRFNAACWSVAAAA